MNNNDTVSKKRKAEGDNGLGLSEGEGFNSRDVKRLLSITAASNAVEINTKRESTSFSITQSRHLNLLQNFHYIHPQATAKLSKNTSPWRQSLDGTR